MKIIKELSLHQMRKGAHINYMREVLEKAEADPAVSVKAKSYVRRLRSALEAESKVMNVSTKSRLSDSIAVADCQRGALYTSFKFVLTGFAKLTDSTMSEAARDLRQLVKDFAIDTRAPMVVESGMMKKFVHELETAHRPQVETLGLGILVSELRKANDEVERLMTQRTEARQGRLTGEMKAARKVTDKAYAHLVGMVNGLVYVDGGNAYDDFVDFVNEQIAYYRSKAMGMKGKKTKTDSEEQGEEEAAG